MKKEHKKYLYIFTLLFFALGFVNIMFAYLGLICMIMPFVFLWKDRQKTWCQQYCPRSHLFNAACPKSGFKIPRFITAGAAKWMIMVYFVFNLAVIIFTTVTVANGKPPSTGLNLFMYIHLPFELPQLLIFPPVPDPVLHMAYRLYSMMLSMTILGMVLGLFYKPRTWCAVCPINTVSNGITKQMQKSNA